MSGLERDFRFCTKTECSFPDMMSSSQPHKNIYRPATRNRSRRTSLRGMTGSFRHDHNPERPAAPRTNTKSVSTASPPDSYEPSLALQAGPRESKYLSLKTKKSQSCKRLRAFVAWTEAIWTEQRWPWMPNTWMPASVPEENGSSVMPHERRKPFMPDLPKEKGVFSWCSAFWASAVQTMI